MVQIINIPVGSRKTGSFSVQKTFNLYYKLASLLWFDIIFADDLVKEVKMIFSSVCANSAEIAAKLNQIELKCTMKLPFSFYNVKYKSVSVFSQKVLKF